MGATAATALMFVGDQSGRAREAVEFYAAHVPGVSVEQVDSLPAEVDPAATDLVRAQFSIGGTRFIAFDGGRAHDFTFTPAVSIWLDLETEAELGSLADVLADGGKVLMPLGDYGFSRAFAWVDDRFGVSWQLNLPAAAPA